MTRPLAFVAFAAACHASATPTPAPRDEPRWPRVLQLGGTEDGDLVGHDLAVMPSGAVMLVACYTGAVDLGGGTIARAARGSLLVASYPPEGGGPRWARHAGSRCDGTDSRIAIDDDGRVFVVARGVGELGELEAAPGADGPDVPVLLRLDDGGEVVWRAPLGEQDLVYGLAPDGEGGVVAVGLRTLPTAWGSGFVTAFDAEGAVRWDRVFTGGPSSSVFITDVVVDADGLAIAGNFDRELHSEGLDREEAAASNVFVARLDARDGAIAALHAYGATNIYFDGQHIAVAVAPDGRDLLVAGAFSGPSGAAWNADLGWGSTVQYAGDVGPYFLFALRVDPDTGTVRWARIWTGTNVFANVADQVVVGDTVAVTILLGPWEEPPLDIDFGAGGWSNPAGTDLVAVSVATDTGADARAARFRGASQLRGGRAAAAADGAVLVTGAFTDQLIAADQHLHAFTKTVDPCESDRGRSLSLFGTPPPDPCRPHLVEADAGFVGRVLP